MIEWNPNLAVGVAKIDLQHKELLKAFNGLQEAMMKGRGPNEVLSTLRFLGDYAVSHFDTEESLMRLHDYPAFIDHRMAHEGFKRDFGRFQKEAEASPTRLAVTIEVSRRLLDWLLAHIGKTDKALGAFLVKKGVA